MLKWILRWLFRVLIILVVVALLSLVGLLVVELLQVIRTAKLPPPADVTTAIAALVTGIVTAFGVAVAIVAGFYAQRQLKTAQETARWDFILRVDERFRSREQIAIYKKIKYGAWKSPNGPKTDEEWTTAEGYLRLFERIYFLTERGLIDKDIARKMWGYRLKQVFDNTTFQEQIKAESNQKNEPYIHVYQLGQKLKVKGFCDNGHKKKGLKTDIRTWVKWLGVLLALLLLLMLISAIIPVVFIFGLAFWLVLQSPRV